MQSSSTTSSQAKRAPAVLHEITQLTTTGTIRRYNKRDTSDTSDDSSSYSDSDSQSTCDCARDTTSKDDGGHASKRARVGDGVPVGNGAPVGDGVTVDDGNFIAPFAPDEVSERYAIVKGVQPGIYDTA
jgi:hypothetical protein